MRPKTKTALQFWFARIISASVVVTEASVMAFVGALDLFRTGLFIIRLPLMPHSISDRELIGFDV